MMCPVASAFFDLPEVPDWDHPGLAEFDGITLHRNASLDLVKAHGRGGFCYLATPFPGEAHEHNAAFPASLEAEASVRTARWALALLDLGVVAVSPVIQSVEMAFSDLERVAPAASDAGAWGLHFQPLLDAAAAVIVPPVPGWQACESVWDAARAKLAINRLVFVIAPEEVQGGLNGR